MAKKRIGKQDREALRGIHCIDQMLADKAAKNPKLIAVPRGHLDMVMRFAEIGTAYTLRMTEDGDPKRVRYADGLLRRVVKKHGPHLGCIDTSAILTSWLVGAHFKETEKGGKDENL